MPGWGDPLEEGMATHSSVLAWRIPWTEEPGGLQATGSQSRTRLSTCRQVSRPPLCSRAFRLHLEAAAAGASCRAADSAWGQGCLSVRAWGWRGEVVWHLVLMSGSRRVLAGSATCLKSCDHRGVAYRLSLRVWEGG